MHDFDQFERRLAGALRSDADANVGPFEAGSIAQAAIAASQSGATRLPRASSRLAKRFGGGRGMTLLVAAALLLGGGALAAGSGILRLPTVVPPVPSPSVVAVATASPDATSRSPNESAAPFTSPIPAVGPGGVWIPTGSMVTPRVDHTAVRLQDGRVLVAGGFSDPEQDLTSAELYDPATGTWSETGNMLRPRGGFPATLLHDGRVLVGDDDGDEQGAEVYDPASGTWSATGPMVVSGDTATLLGDGKVLVRGDSGSELYDPVTGSWTATASRPAQRHSNAAVLLHDGRVLVAGGHIRGDTATASAELYDPDTQSWTAAAKMLSKRESIEAFLLPDGKVLAVGSSRGEPESAESYDPVTGAWTAIGDVAGPRIWEGGSATLLSNGMLLVAGGADSPDAALFDPVSGSWMTAASMFGSHNGATATLLLDGTVLVAGGRDCLDDRCIDKGFAELYVPAGISPPPLPAFPSPPPPVFPSPTPRATPLPPAAGPVPPNARSWKVTVDNKSSEPATLFVAEEGEGGLRLVGSATPNVVPAGATVKVTFRFPAKGDPDDGWIYVNPRPGEGGSLVNANQIGIPGKIVITADGQVGWLSP